MRAPRDRFLTRATRGGRSLTELRLWIEAAVVTAVIAYGYASPFLG